MSKNNAVTEKAIENINRSTLLPINTQLKGGKRMSLSCMDEFADV